MCRGQQEKYISAARLRVRELESGFKTSKRELRHARKTVKTFEAMAVMGKLGGVRVCVSEFVCMRACVLCMLCVCV